MVIGQSSPGSPSGSARVGFGGRSLVFLAQSRSFVIGQSAAGSQVFAELQRLSIDDLSGIYEKFKGDPTRSLAVAFCEYFGYGSPSSVQEWGAKIGRKHHLVVVTDGADDDTIAAVNHWQRHGLDIDLWPYRVYVGDKDSFRLELPELYIRGHRISTSVPAFTWSIRTEHTNRRRRRICWITVSH
jgi:hypothetical protein